MIVVEAVYVVTIILLFCSHTKRICSVKFRRKNVLFYTICVTQDVYRPVIKPSKPSRPSARARLGGLHARFGLLGGPSWPLGLGSVRPSSPIGCLRSARLNRTEQRGCLRSAEHARRSRIPGS